MLCKCGKLFCHNYKAYYCSELKVRIPLYDLKMAEEGVDETDGILSHHQQRVGDERLETDEELTILAANRIFVLMRKEYRCKFFSI